MDENIVVNFSQVCQTFVQGQVVVLAKQAEQKVCSRFVVWCGLLGSILSEVPGFGLVDVVQARLKVFCCGFVRTGFRIAVSCEKESLLATQNRDEILIVASRFLWDRCLVRLSRLVISTTEEFKF